MHAWYCTTLFMQVTDDLDSRHLRSTAHGDIVILRTNTKTLGQRSFAVKGPVIWNGLPACMHKNDLSLNCFHRELKKFYFSRAYVHDQVRLWQLLLWERIKLNWNCTGLNLTLYRFNLCSPSLGFPCLAAAAKFQEARPTHFLNLQAAGFLSEAANFYKLVLWRANDHMGTSLIIIMD